MTSPKLGIIMLTYNSISKLGDFFSNVLRSLLQVDYENTYLLIVDNASRDNTMEYVKRYINSHPCKHNIGILRLRKNYGWAGGNNRGALLLKKLVKNLDYLLFINDDLILAPSTAKKLVIAMEKHKELGVVQPVVVNIDGTYNMGFDLSLGFTPSPITMLSSKNKFLDKNIIEISYAIGAALLTRSKLFFELNMFDEDYFFWFDDVDYCLKVQDIGFKVGCVLDALAYHYGSATIGKDNPRLVYYYARNHIRLLIKGVPLLKALPYWMLGFVESISTTLLHSLRYRDSISLVYAILGYKDALKGIRKRMLMNSRTYRKLSPELTAKVLKLIE